MSLSEKWQSFSLGIIYQVAVAEARTVCNVTAAHHACTVGCSCAPYMHNSTCWDADAQHVTEAQPHVLGAAHLQVRKALQVLL